VEKVNDVVAPGCAIRHSGVKHGEPWDDRPIPCACATLEVKPISVGPEGVSDGCRSIMAKKTCERMSSEGLFGSRPILAENAEQGVAKCHERLP
jgi:hypothetical protein